MNAGSPGSDHVGVEDDRRVRPALVGSEEVDDRVAADLLLAVAADTDVDRKLAGLRELAGAREERIELALVVDRAAPVEIPVADLGLERIALPELERCGRLDVEMAVEKHGRGVAAVRGADLADRERVALPVDHLRLAAGVAHEVRDPAGGAHDVAGVRRVGAHRRDAEKIRQLVEPRMGHLDAKLRWTIAGESTQATSRSFSASARMRSFFNEWFSI